MRMRYNPPVSTEVSMTDNEAQNRSEASRPIEEIREHIRKVVEDARPLLEYAATDRVNHCYPLTGRLPE